MRLSVREGWGVRGAEAKCKREMDGRREREREKMIPNVRQRYRDGGGNDRRDISEQRYLYF